MRHVADEHYNLAGEYNKGQGLETLPPYKTIAPPSITLDQYVGLVRSVGKCAFTYTKPKRREYDELDEILMRLDPV